MVFNSTFNNISVISWWSVCIGGENHWPAAGYGQIVSHNTVSNIPRDSGIRTHNVTNKNVML